MRVGLDIGGTSTHAIALAASGAVIAELEIPSGYGEAAVVRRARAAVSALVEHVGEPVETIGVGIPGNVDPATGVVAHAVNLGIERLDLAGSLADLAASTVAVDNDVNAAALGTYESLGHAPHSAAFLNVGTGLAAGLVLDGAVWRGAGNVAGELGHFSIDPNGSACPCGQRGCLETVASGTAIAARWRGTRSFSDSVTAGDPDALALARGVAEGIADAVQLLALLVGIERIVLGGGVVRHTPGLMPSVVSILDARAIRSPFLASLAMSSRLQPEPTGASLSALGAAYLPAETSRLRHRSDRRESAEQCR